MMTETSYAFFFQECVYGKKHLLSFKSPNDTYMFQCATKLYPLVHYKTLRLTPEYKQLLHILNLAKQIGSIANS
jgi:hypothetical protein